VGEEDLVSYQPRYWPTVEDPAAYGSTAELIYRDGMALQLLSGGSNELNGLTVSYAEHEYRRELRLREWQYC
jgi:hypothetical protein